MPDREKVIKGLECCRITDNDIACTDCPYNDPTTFEYGENHCLRKELMPDALSLLKEQDGLAKAVDQEHRTNEYLTKENERLKALLKEQEPVPPEKESDGNPGKWASWWYVCGACGGEIDYHDRFCRHCGREVKWE